MKAFLAGVAAARGAVDRTLGRLTPVLLIAAVLWIIAIVALILMLVGAMPFDALAGVLSLIISIAGAFVGAWIGGAAVRARPEFESVLVTGLLVFLLFTPRLEGPELGSVALASVLAGASRFLIARHGRHIFNPAAFGALVVSLLAATLDLLGAPVLAGATWWVATPVLLPFVAVGALLICYRSSVVTIALTYIVVATVLRTIQFVSFGLPVWDALTTIIGSLPIVFAAGFMLSEPQTLPPRWWQRLLVAAIAAVIASWPFVLGPVYSSPELGLVVANVVAFAFGARRAIRLTVTGVDRPSRGVVQLRMRPQVPVTHAAGQAIEFALPGGARDFRGRRRVLSIASAPGSDELRLAFGMPANASAAKRSLAALEPGAQLVATRVFGDFTAPRPGSQALLVAGGIGITPFLSMLSGAHPDSDLVLVYRSSEEEPPFLAELAELEHRVVLSCPVAPEPMPQGWVWLGPGRFDAEDLAAVIPDLPSRTAYISGPPAMVASLTAALRRVGVARIRRDVFSGA
jgi:ferredoxin-NADP reductase